MLLTAEVRDLSDPYDARHVWYTYPQDVRLSCRADRLPMSPPEWVHDRTPKSYALHVQQTG